MKVWNTFPMLRLLLPFVSGVVLSAFLIEDLTFKLEYLVAGLVAILIVAIGSCLVFSFGRKPYRFGLLLWPILFSLGALLTISVSNYIFPDYLHESNNGPQSYLAVIADQPQVKDNSVKIVADVSDFESKTHGKVLLYFAKDSASAVLKYGQEILIRTQLQQVRGMGNPNEFNYSRYLRFHDILFRGYVRSTDWKNLSEGKTGLQGCFFSIRSKLIDKFEEAGLTGNELSVASALVLGYRTELDKELMSAYAGAGATHVLAVSGLHVGIVYVILNALLKFLDRKKSLRVVKTLLLVFLLFGYAGLTGLSASVFRAATMFFFVAIGKAIDRNTNIFNTLAASAFCLILYEPMIIMQVGFQLSYLAVIGIVIIHPELFKLTYFNNRLADWAWSITCVSISAQIATFALGLLYFHQFPNLFLLSNLLVIPAAGLILYLGFSLILASIWKPAMLFFGFLLDTIISSLNQVVVWIERIPYSVISGIDISTAESLIIYFIISGGVIFIIYKQRFGIYLSLSLSIIFMTLQVLEVHQQKSQQFMALYNVKNQTVLGLINGTDLTVLCSQDFWNNEQSRLFHVQHHWWNVGIDMENFVELDETTVNRKLQWGEKTFVVLNLVEEANYTNLLEVADSLDFVILSDLAWENCSLLKKLGTKHIIVSNNFGEKMGHRIAKHTEDKYVQWVSKQGMIQL